MYRWDAQCQDEREAEWKSTLVKEVESLTTRLVNAETEISLKGSQFDQLKSDFKHNLQLLKERDTIITENAKAISLLKKCLYERDILLSEVKASLDRCQVALVSSKAIEANLQEELERTRDEYCKRELSSNEKHTEELNIVKQGQISQHEAHSKEIAKLRSDLNMQRLQLTRQLDETLADADKRVSECTSRSSQERFALELRIKLLQEMHSQTITDKEMLQKDIKSKDAEIDQLHSQLALAEQQAESLTMQLRENIDEFTTVRQEKLDLDVMYRKEMEQRKVEKEEFTNKLEKISTQLNWNRNEVARLSNRIEDLKAASEVEHQSLLDQVTREETKTSNAMTALKEAEAAKLLAERSARTARSECDRLRKDLEISLSSSTPVRLTDDKITACDLKNAAELQCMRENNRKLEGENVRLKQAIAVMSEQVKQTEKHLNKMQIKDVCGTSPPGAPLTNGESKSLEVRLKHAVNHIQRLVQEKTALTELSNRLQAQVRHLTGPQFKSPSDLHTNGTAEIRKLKDCSMNSTDSGRHSKSSRPGTSNRNQEYDDALSSVGGGESVTAVFKLLDDR